MTPGPLRRWVLAARVRTLPAAAVPVALGATLAGSGVNVGRTLLALVVALSLQIATNYANDYSDGVRGTDENRVGPFRITASGLVEPRVVRSMAFAFFGIAGVAGLLLALLSSWWLLPIGAAAVLAGWFYTGGPKPYGYLGLGELFVLIFFGFVATVGTAYVQHDHIPKGAWWWGLSAGSMACAHVPVVTANLLISTGAKRVGAGPGQDHAAHVHVVAGPLEGIGEFEQCLGPKGVSHMGSVYRDARHALGELVDDVFVLPFATPVGAREGAKAIDGIDGGTGNDGVSHGTTLPFRSSLPVLGWFHEGPCRARLRAVRETSSRHRAL